jgi:hypothetical protein
MNVKASKKSAKKQKENSGFTAGHGKFYYIMIMIIIIYYYNYYTIITIIIIIIITIFLIKVDYSINFNKIMKIITF